MPLGNPSSVYGHERRSVTSFVSHACTDSTAKSAVQAMPVEVVR